jgi:hypothetical protein
MSKRRHLLPRERRLGGSRNVLQYKIVLVAIQAQFDDRIPVFSRKVILIHTLDDFIHRGLIKHKTG